MDAFVFRGPPGGPAVLGEGAQAQVPLAVVQRIFQKKSERNGVEGGIDPGGRGCYNARFIGGCELW